MRKSVERLGKALLKASPLRFAMVGTLAFCVDSLVLEGLIWTLAINPLVARVFSWLTAATTAWYLNRSFTFQLPASQNSAREWLHYLLANALGGAVNYGVFAILVTYAPPFHSFPVLGVAAGALSGMSFNYVTSRFWVFRQLLGA